MAEVMLTINAHDKTGAAFRSVEDAAKSAFDKIKSAVAAIVGIGALEELIRQSTMAATQAEAYGVSLKVLGQNVGYASDQLDAYVESMTKLNFTNEAARAALSGMIERNISLTNATKLATIAQDASTVSHESAVQSLDTLNFAISTGMTRTLKHMGIIVDFTTAENKYAEAHGTSTAFLTEKEKMQIRVNEVERAAISIHGAYAAGLETAEGITKRLAVATEEAKDEFGKLFLPVYKEILSELLGVMTNVQKWFEANPGKIHEWGNAFVGTLYDVEAEVIRVSMLLDKMGGTMTAAGMLLFGLGSALGNENSKKQFEALAQANLDYEKRFEEGNKRLEDLALKRNALMAPPPTPKSNAAEAAKGGADTSDRDSAEKNRLIIEQNKGLLASYWSVNDAVVKLTGSNVDQANAQDMVFFSSKEYLDLVKNHSPLAQAILDEQKHLHSLQAIDAAYKDTITTLDAFRTAQKLAEESQDMQTGAMGNVWDANQYDKQYQVLKDSHDKMLNEQNDFINKQKASMQEMFAYGTSMDEARYEAQQKILDAALKKRQITEEDYAAKKAVLDHTVFINEVTGVANALGQVSQLMMTGNKHQFEMGKDLAIAQATISGALAVVEAWSSTPNVIVNAVLAAGALAATAVQIAKIESTQYSPRASGGPVEAGGNYLVGEEGPELIRMGAAGTVVPNNALAQAGKEQLNATHELIDAVHDNTAAVTKVADGFTKIAGMLDNFVGNFQVFTAGLAAPNLEKGPFEKLASRDEAALIKIAGPAFEKFADSWVAGPLNWGKSLTEHTGSLIFGGQQSLAGQGIALGYGPGGVQGSQYVETHTKGGLFGGGHNDTEFSALPSDFQKILQDNSQLLKDAIINAAAAMGQGAEGINAATLSMEQISLRDMSPEDQAKAVEAWFAKLANAFSSGVAGLDAMKKPGEDSFSALIRLSTALQAVNENATKFGGTVLNLSLQTADASSKLVDQLGGLDEYLDKTSKYFDLFYTSGEQARIKAEIGAREAGAEFAKLGMVMPNTADGFKNIVSSLDLTTEAGRDAYSALINMSTAADDFYKHAQAVADAGTALGQDLAGRLYQLSGNTASDTLYKLRIDQAEEIAKAEKEGLLTTEQITQLKIVQEKEWAQAVVDASKTVATALSRIQSSALNTMKDIMTSAMGLSPEAAYRQAQQGWATASLSGNESLLNDAANQLVSASKAYNASGPAFQADVHTVLDKLGEVAGIGPNATIDKVMTQISLLQRIADATSQTAQNTMSKADYDKSIAAQTYGRAYDTFESTLTGARSAYLAGGSFEAYTSAVTPALSAIESAQTTALSAGVTTFTDISGASHDIGTTAALESEAAAPVRRRSVQWAQAGIDIISDAMAKKEAFEAKYNVPTFPYYDITRSYYDVNNDQKMDWADVALLRAMIANPGTLPSYAVGTPYLSSDMPLDAHRGEAIVDARSNEVLQKYGIRVHAGGTDNSALIAEIRELRREVADLKAQVVKHGSAQVRVSQEGFTKTIAAAESQAKSQATIASKTRLANLQRTA